MMQNFREKYAYKISLYLIIFLLLFLSLLSSFSLSTSSFEPWGPILSLLLYYTVVIVLMILPLSLFLRFFSLDASKKWLDIILTIVLLLIFILDFVTLLKMSECVQYYTDAGSFISPASKTEGFKSFFELCWTRPTYFILQYDFPIFLSFLFFISILLPLRYLFLFKRSYEN